MTAVVAYMNGMPDSSRRLIYSLATVLALWGLRYLVYLLIRGRVREERRLYHFRRWTAYLTTLAGVFLVGRLWFRGLDRLATYLGLASAGLAIALHDTVANLAGFIFIVARTPFSVGDRIEIGDVAGDVVDGRLFEFSVIEVGNWVEADQSTGRIVHVPNSKVLREPLANYETGFAYVWHEIPVVVTFESNWRKAKEILQQIAQEKTEHLSEGAEEQIRRAAMRYLIYFQHLSPTVYTTVRENGVLLTMRYIVKPRERRNSEARVWESILDAFAERADVDLAYPTTRFFERPRERGDDGRRADN